MSGEGAVGFAVVSVVGGSIWLAARGVQAGALVAARSVDLLGAGLVMVGDRAERSRAEWEAGNAALQEWEAAARQVIDVNARIDVLRHQAGADLAATLPDVLMPCSESPAELSTWCAAARATVDDVEKAVLARTATAVLAVLRHSVDLKRPVTAQEAFDRYQQALRDRSTQRRTVPPEALASVVRIVGGLSADASRADRADVLAAAVQVAVPRPDVDHHTLLDELRLRVQRADQRARSRREDAIAAATMLQALAEGVGADPELPGVRAELAEVVVARRALDAGLRSRAGQAAGRVRERLERDYVRGSVASTLAELGYEVDEGFATVTGNPDRMRLSHLGWDGHAVQVVVDGDEVKAAVVRLENRSGADARREDVEREQEWCGDLEKLRAALAGAGVRVAQRRLVPPGDRVPPVVKRRVTPGIEQQQSRKHTG
jgi:hypothetical protein